MYDSVLREKCENPTHYDRMIALIAKYNPAAQNDVNWASETVNICIRGVVYGGYDDYGTGCCVAKRNGEGKVRLFLEPLIPIPSEGES